MVLVEKASLTASPCMYVYLLLLQPAVKLTCFAQCYINAKFGNGAGKHKKIPAFSLIWSWNRPTKSLIKQFLDISDRLV